MKVAALPLLLLSLVALAPLAPAATSPSTADRAAECCQTDPDCCATACPCPPLSCQTSGATIFILPAVAPAIVFAPCCSPAAQFENDSYVVRTSRPPVPPPRA